MVCLLLLALGCASRDKASYASEAPQSYAEEERGYGGDSGYYEESEAGYDFKDDMIEGDVLAPGGAAISSRGPSPDTESEFKREAPAELAEPPSPEPEPASVDLELPEQPRDGAKQAAARRQIIYTANMQVSVYDVEHSMSEVEALPERFGGWLHQRLDNQIILRIPAEQLEQAMAVIAELGVVDYRTLEALDVTAEFTDLESRIRILTEMQAQLELLLAKAKDVEQALEIRRALDEVTLELELVRGRMRELSKSIAFSTLIIRVVARGPVDELPSSNDPFPWVLELGVEATEYR
ncbi:DUF4349 domain-containing protein [Enhygromyxa salina]|uniref:DUF4349 domain-containing protein n=1 Tax=Enhygromyxa salina TaxID=215803 RepID=UPI0015E5BEE5|nr:DUF4349 domain-containing protein [Enhygromyxa salina]